MFKRHVDFTIVLRDIINMIRKLPYNSPLTVFHIEPKNHRPRFTISDLKETIFISKQCRSNTIYRRLVFVIGASAMNDITGLQVLTNFFTIIIKG